MAKTNIAIDASDFAGLVKKIESLRPEVSKAVRNKAMPKAVQLVKEKMIATAPTSQEKDTRRQSRSHKKKWEGTPKLKDTVEGVIRDHEINAFTGFVGVAFPWGNKAYFDYYGKKSRRVFAWGKDMQRTKKKVQWMVRVMDAAGPQVKLIIESAISEAVGKHMREKH